jgi:hypothetical protein
MWAQKANYCCVQALPGGMNIPISTQERVERWTHEYTTSYPQMCGEMTTWMYKGDLLVRRWRRAGDTRLGSQLQWRPYCPVALHGTNHKARLDLRANHNEELDRAQETPSSAVVQWNLHQTGVGKLSTQCTLCQRDTDYISIIVLILTSSLINLMTGEGKLIIWTIHTIQCFLIVAVT